MKNQRFYLFILENCYKFLMESFDENWDLNCEKSEVLSFYTGELLQIPYGIIWRKLRLKLWKIRGFIFLYWGIVTNSLWNHLVKIVKIPQFIEKKFQWIPLNLYLRIVTKKFSEKIKKIKKIKKKIFWKKVKIKVEKNNFANPVLCRSYWGTSKFCFDLEIRSKLPD